MSPRSAAPLTLEFVLLGLVAETPAHGYELYQALHHLRPLSLVWNVGQPQLYALLDKLERQELLAGELLPGEGHPSRRQFHLTPSGRQRFDAWRSAPVDHGRDMRQEFLAKLFFARRAGQAQALIERQRATCSRWQARLNRQLEALSPDQVDERLVYSFRARQVQTLLEWLDQAAEWTRHE